MNKKPFTRFSDLIKSSLVTQIFIGFCAGILLASVSPSTATHVSVLGSLFIDALKSVAPILVFVLVTASIANHQHETKVNIRPILFMYLISTFFAAVIAVIVSFAFPTTLTLSVPAQQISPPTGIDQVLQGLLEKIVSNPIDALLHANYIGILVWAIGLGIMLRHSQTTTKTLITDLSNAITQIVRLVIHFAPLGIFGIVASTLAKTGFSELSKYAHLLAVLLGCMLLVTFVLNPILVFWKLKRNPYPLIFLCLRESGTSAFFTRSSAANIPVNMALCKKLNLHEDTYSVSIPLGATISMAGASVTITVLTLAAVHTLGIPVDLLSALLFSFVTVICACGASGVAGGSLLLIPLACSLFGISNEIAAQVVSIGFIISILQDSTETAVNSSTDALFTATVCLAEEQKESAMQAVE